MSDHTDNDLRAAIQALTTVVAPAVDRNDVLARQQMALVIDWLEFYRARRPLLQRRERFELASQLDAARRAQAAAGVADTGPAASALSDAIADAAALASRLDFDPDAVSICTGRLQDEITALVQRANDFEDAAAARSVEHVVLTAARPWLDAQRAWFLPMSIELDPSSLPPLEAALDFASISTGDRP